MALQFSQLCSIRIIPLTVNLNKGLINTHTSRVLLYFPGTTASFKRNAHTQNITKNMQFISNDQINLKMDPVTMKLNEDLEKPLCVMMTFMLATPKTMLKYADLYLKHGFDVVTVSCEPLQLMWPVKGSQVVAARLLNFLTVNNCGRSHPLVVHGFSVGAYLWAELLVHTTMNKERYQPVLDRIAAQVWDSGADVHEIPEGFPRAVFPNSKFLQKVARFYIKSHMAVFHNVATKHYFRATDVYHETPCKAPGLFLVSKTDPVGAEKRSRRAAAMWEERGIKCNFKCWDRSPHVQHYLRHPEEYRNAVYSHLDECGVLHRKS